MSNYYSMRDGKTRIARELINKGWTVFGYSPSWVDPDPGCDYPYHAAHWGGVATKNGFILVVDIDRDVKETEIKKYNPAGHLSFDDMEKITKLEQMTTARGCTEAEEKTSKELIEKIKNKITDIPEYEVVGVIPAHMGNPGKSKWHIEKDGKIYDKGTGITKYSNIPDSDEFDIDKMEYIGRYKEVWTGYDENGQREYKERQLTEEMRKSINDFKKLITRLESIVNIDMLGDGTQETEQKAKEHQKNAGYEKVIVKETKTSLKMVEVTDRKFIKIGDYLTFSYHGGYWKITHSHMQKGTWKINGIPEKMEKLAFTYNIVGKASRGYQDLKNAKGYYQYEDRLLKEIEAGTTKIYELKEVEEIISVEKWVKIDKSKNTYNNKPKSNQEENQQEQSKETEININTEFTITEDVDTRDNSKLWVAKLKTKISYEDFKKIEKEIIKPLNGYYSKFKKGFIFKYDPSEKLNSNQESEIKEENYNNVAENIIDTSTTIIEQLNIKDGNIVNNEQYKTLLYDYINNSNIDITIDIINYIKNKYGFNNLIDILELIQSGYWQPIRDNYIYDCHFKEWSIPIKEIKETITALGIKYIDMGEKIGFEGLTADQTRQVKEISDINESILFIDAEVPITEYNNRPEQPQQEQETNNDSIFDFDNILNQFDNIEINNNSRISAEDEIFCKDQEKEYKDFIVFSNQYIEHLENNSFKNSIYNSDCLITAMEEEQNNKKYSFVNKVVYYFKDKYKVTLTSDNINKKYDLNIDYNTIVNEIIDQLDGYSFIDKAEKEIKDEFKETIKHNKIKVSNYKISFDSFFYANCDNYGSGNKYSVSYSYDSKFRKLFKSISHFINIKPENFETLCRTITSENNELVFKTHDIDNNIIKSLKLYKNGKIDIEFSNSEYTRKFAKEYCGYIEKSA